MNLELGLETPAPEEKAYSVTDLVTALRNRINELPPLWVEGEVSGFRKMPSGQWYFTLKDKTSEISCVVWSDDARKLREPPEEGMKVFVNGRVAIYVEKGRLQFTIKQLLPRPEGGFHALKLERARKALEKDGLLDPARKRPIPVFPQRVGVVTSAEGAAWRDIQAVVARRWPCCELILVRAQVQGEGAPKTIIRAIELANRFGKLDVLIVGRGGGSKEDLHAFNDEYVARAVAASSVPTISAVGHEVDFTLTDLVADFRAPTPSAAAEKATPDRADLEQRLAGLGAHLSHAAAGRVENAALRIRSMMDRMDKAATRRFQDVHAGLDQSWLRMSARCDAMLARGKSAADRLGASLEALSPLKVLERGYSVARAEDGHVLKAVADFPAGRNFRLRVVDGEVHARSEVAR